MLTLLDQCAEIQSHLERTIGFSRAAKLVAFFLYRGTFGEAATRAAWGLCDYQKNMLTLRRAQRDIDQYTSRRNPRLN